MANRFFIESPARNIVGQGINTALKLQQLGQQRQIALGQQDVARERTRMMGRQADISERRVDIEQQKLDFKKRLHEEATKPMKPAGVVSDWIFKFENEGEAGKKVLNILTPVTNTLKLAAQQGAQRKEGFAATQKVLKANREKISEDLEKLQVNYMKQGDVQKADFVSKVLNKVSNGTLMYEIAPVEAMYSAWLLNEEKRKNMGAEATLLKAQQGGAKSTLGKMVDEYNALPEDSPFKKSYLGAIAKQGQAEGLSLSLDENGKLTFTQGPIGKSGMTRKTQSGLQERAITAQEGIARLNEIASSYKPEFLQLNTKLKALNYKWQSIGKDTPIESVLGGIFGRVSAQDQELIEDYWDWRRSSINNINLYIKEITGAQMSEKEAGRIRQGMPDPGEGLFDGDAPPQFQKKWNSAMHSLRMMQARTVQMMKQGFTHQDISRLARTDQLKGLDQISSEIDERGDELEKAGYNDMQIKQIIQDEFFSLR